MERPQASGGDTTAPGTVLATAGFLQPQTVLMPSASLRRKAEKETLGIA